MRVAAIAIGVSAGALATEAVVRLVAVHVEDQGLPSGDTREMLRYSASARLGWELAPGKLDHNADGYRGPAVARQKPAGTWRVAVLGDSVTYGLGIAAAEAYPAALQERLTEPGRGPVEVLNFGVPGYSTFQELTLLEERVAAYSPDVVVMTFSTDDVETSPVVLLVEGRPTLFRNQFEGHAWLDSALHWSMVRRSHAYRLFYERLVLLSLGEASFADVHVQPEAAWRNVLSASAWCRTRGAGFVLALSPVIPPLQGPDAPGLESEARALDRIRDWAKAAGFLVADFGPLFEEGGARFKVHPDDSEHPNALGARAMAELLARTLESMRPASPAPLRSCRPRWP